MHIYSLRVPYEDIDVVGLIYNPAYLRYFERARGEYFRNLGMPYTEILRTEDYFLVVKNYTIDFLVPAYMDDTLTIETKILIVKGASLEMQQQVFRDGQKLVTMAINLVCLTKNQKPTRFPHKVSLALKAAAA